MGYSGCGEGGLCSTVIEAWSLNSVGGLAGRANEQALSFANLGSSAFQTMPGQLGLADRCLFL